MGCEPWLSPGRDCARSAARHGVLLGVRVRQLRATGAPQSVVKKTRAPRLCCISADFAGVSENRASCAISWCPADAYEK